MASSRLAFIQNVAELESVLGKTGLLNASGRNAATSRQRQTIRRKQRELMEKEYKLMHQPLCAPGHVCATWNVCSREYPNVAQDNLFVLSPVLELPSLTFSWVESIENKVVTSGETGIPYKCGAIEKYLYKLNPVQVAHLIRQKQVSRQTYLHWMVFLSRLNQKMKVWCRKCGCLYSKGHCNEQGDNYVCKPCCGEMPKPDGRVRVPNHVGWRYKQHVALYRSANIESLFEKDAQGNPFYLYEPSKEYSKPEMVAGARLVSFSAARQARELKEMEAHKKKKEEDELEAKRKALIERVQKSIAEEETRTVVELLKANPLVQDMLKRSILDAYSPGMEALNNMPDNFRSWLGCALDAGHSPEKLLLSPTIAHETCKEDGKAEPIDFLAAKKSISQYVVQSKALNVPVPKLEEPIIFPISVSTNHADSDTDESSSDDYDPFTEEPSAAFYISKLQEEGMVLEDEADPEPPAKRSKVVLKSRADVDGSYNKDTNL
jgi:hypothetical protein